MNHRATRRLDATTIDLASIRAELPRALDALTLVTADGYPTGGGNGRSGDIARPTEQAACQGEHNRQRYLELDALTAELQGLAGLLLAAIRDIPDTATDTEYEAALARCSGGVDDWADPTCKRNAVLNVGVGRGRRIPLCWACRKRWQRWKKSVHHHADQAS